MLQCVYVTVCWHKQRATVILNVKIVQPKLKQDQVTGSVHVLG